MRTHLAILMATRLGAAGLGAAALAAAAPAAAGGHFEAVLEIERYVSGGNQLLAAQREATQLNIEGATNALQAKDYARARKYARLVTRQDPKRVEAWLLLGAAQQGLGDWKGARSTYTTAVRISPRHPEARAGLGIAYARTSDPRATVQLAWLSQQAQACGGTCRQADQLKRLTADLEAVLAQGG